MAAAVQLAALVRHGAYAQPPGVPSAHLPHPLTSQGRAQAQRAGAELADHAESHGLDVDPVIDTSRMLRAWETGTVLAEALAQRVGHAFRVEEHDGLAERCVGAVANLTVDEIASIVAADPRLPELPDGWKLRPEFRLPFVHAESLLDAGRRVTDHLERRMSALPETGRGRLKIFVGHGGAFRHAAVHLGVLGLSEVQGLSMHHGGYVLLERSGRERWKQVGGAWRIRSTHKVPRE